MFQFKTQIKKTLSKIVLGVTIMVGLFSTLLLSPLGNINANASLLCPPGWVDGGSGSCEQYTPKTNPCPNGGNNIAGTCTGAPDSFINTPDCPIYSSGIIGEADFCSDYNNDDYLYDGPGNSCGTYEMTREKFNNIQLGGEVPVHYKANVNFQTVSIPMSARLFKGQIWCVGMYGNLAAQTITGVYSGLQSGTSYNNCTRAPYNYNGPGFVATRTTCTSATPLNDPWGYPTGLTQLPIFQSRGYTNNVNEPDLNYQGLRGDCVLNSGSTTVYSCTTIVETYLAVNAFPVQNWSTNSQKTLIVAKKTLEPTANYPASAVCPAGYVDNGTNCKISTPPWAVQLDNTANIGQATCLNSNTMSIGTTTTCTFPLTGSANGVYVLPKYNIGTGTSDELRATLIDANGASQAWGDACSITGAVLTCTGISAISTIPLGNNEIALVQPNVQYFRNKGIEKVIDGSVITASMVKTGVCTSVIVGSKTNCVFPLVGSPNGTYKLPPVNTANGNTKSLVGIIGNLAWNIGQGLGDECTISGAILICNNIPTDPNTAPGQYEGAVLYPEVEFMRSQTFLNLLPVVIKSYVFDLKVNLAGAYSTATNSMRTTLQIKDLVPFPQPYNMAPFNYAGTEVAPNVGTTLAPKLPADVVDWVLVEVQKVDPFNNTVLATERFAALLRSNGQIISKDGASIPKLSNIFIVDNATFKIVIRHRNHLAIASVNQFVVPDVSGVTTIAMDFRTNASVKLGNQSLMSFGVYAMKLGNPNGDSKIQNIDRSILRSSTDKIGYHKEDINLDGKVTSIDRSLQRIAIDSTEQI
jgi:hypothetical protein